MKKWSLWLVTVVILTALIWWGSQRRTTDTLADEFRFRVEDTSQIERILITDKDGEQIDLARTNGSWKVNNTYPARRNAIENLLDAIARIDLQYIPNAAATRTMMADFSNQGIRVDILAKHDEILKSYHVGGATPDERGTFMLMTGSDQPAVTGIPGWEGALRSRYVMRPVDWRSRMIFQLRPEEITRIGVDYPKQQPEAFEIIKTGKDFRIEPLYAQASPLQQIRRGAVEVYLRSYRSIGAEAILEDDTLIRARSNEVPFSIIRCVSNGDSTFLALYPILETAGAGNHIERYHALDSEGTLYLVQHRIFEKLFWSYRSFFEDRKE